MDFNGHILTADQAAALSAEARRRRKLVPIDDADLPRVSAMNRQARRRWHRAQRLKARADARAAKVGGLDQRWLGAAVGGRS